MKANTRAQYISFFITAAVILAVWFGIDTWRNNQFMEGIDDSALQSGILEESIEVDGEIYLVPPNQIVDSGLSQEQVPFIYEPRFENVYTADQVLSDGVPGISVSIDGVDRFYSYQILNWHYGVQDQIGDTHILVSLCPLCQATGVFDIGSAPGSGVFSYAGKVLNNLNLIEDDRGNLWSSIHGMAIAGPDAGSTLTRVNYEVMKWGEWKDRYPAGEVLSVNTGYTRDYAAHPYGAYDDLSILYFPVVPYNDSISQKWVTTIVHGENAAIGFAHRILEGLGPAITDIEGQPIVAIFDEDAWSVVVYDREIDGVTLEFAYDFETGELTDTQTGSVWGVDGIAISGDYTGTALERVPSDQAFWVCASTALGDSLTAFGLE